MNEELLKSTTIWLVWYEDRFYVGDERDPAYVVAFFRTKEEAHEYVISHREYIDSSARVFAGLLLEEWTAADALKFNVIKKEDLQKILRG